MALSSAQLWLSAAALASSGGGGLAPGGLAPGGLAPGGLAPGGLAPGGGTSQTSNQPAPSAATQPGNVTVSAAGNGMTMATTASAFLSSQVRFTGSAPRADHGATVEIERLGHQTGWEWAPTAHATVGSGGSFSVTWHANHIGRFAIRAVIMASGPRGATASPTLTVTVYRQSVATQYGPGLFGHRTACGQVLRRSTLGVANRTLKCGAQVAIYYQGRTITVPVIDRGPYANGADWDLTSATARALKIGGTATIGAVSLPSR